MFAYGQYQKPAVWVNFLDITMENIQKGSLYHLS